MRLFSAVLLVSFAVPALASAQTVVQEPDKVVVRQKTIINIAGATLDGNRDQPVGSYRVVPSASKFKSLIQLRVDFQPELAASTDNVR